MTSDISLLCITKVEPHAARFVQAQEQLARDLNAEMVIIADGREAFYRAHAQFQRSTIVEMHSKGYMESIHDAAIDRCQTKYVLRLDDDELASEAMYDWLLDREYRENDHWKFSRANLWTMNTYIRSGQLWPDHQTRLSTREKSKGRSCIHAGSPFGGGELAPVAIEHYKFIVKTKAERQKIADSYDRIQKGCGSNGMLAFQLPELAYETIPVEPWGSGRVND